MTRLEVGLPEGLQLYTALAYSEGKVASAATVTSARARVRPASSATRPGWLRSGSLPSLGLPVQPRLRTCSLVSLLTVYEARMDP